MDHVRERRFLSSPRTRRRLAWLTGSAITLGVVVTVALLVPNTAGKKKAPEATAPAEGGTGLFWIVASVLVIGFFVALAFLLVRFVWRLRKDDTDPARPGAYAFPNPRTDGDQAMRMSPK